MFWFKANQQQNNDMKTTNEQASELITSSINFLESNLVDCNNLYCKYDF